MGLLHRHIFASVVWACAAAVGLFTFVLLAAFALKDLMAYVVAGQLAPETAIKLAGLLVPYVAVHALPVGVLTAVLLVLGRMSNQHEITAMRAAGLSLSYITRPVWGIALAGVAGSMLLNFEAMPKARSAYKAAFVEAVRSDPVKLIVPRSFVRDFPGFVVYVGERRGDELRDFWLWRLDAQKRVVGVARAESGTLDFREADGVLELKLRNASVETRDEGRPEDFSRPRPIGNSDSLTVELRLDGFFNQMRATKKINWMTLGELTARRAELSALGSAVTDAERIELTRVTMTLSEKVASSFAVLVFALVAVPLGIKVSRKETSANLGIAVALLLAYKFLEGSIGLLERAPALRPELWVWLPPLAYALAGVWLFRRVDRA